MNTSSPLRRAALAASFVLMTCLSLAAVAQGQGKSAPKDATKEPPKVVEQEKKILLPPGHWPPPEKEFEGNCNPDAGCVVYKGSCRCKAVAGGTRG